MSLFAFPSMRSLLPAAIALAILSTTIGCASVVAPTKLHDAAIDVGLPTAPSTSEVSASSVNAHRDEVPWPADPVLAQFLAEARRGSPSLAAARARLDAARAGAGIAARGIAPQGGITAQAGESQLSVVEADPYNQGSPRPPRRRILEAGFAVSWELDLFGRIGTAQAIAMRGLDAEAAATSGAETLLEAEIVRVYTLFRERQSASTSLGAALALSEQRKRDVAHRVEAGLAESPELWQVEAAHSALRAERAAADAGSRSARNQLLAAVGVSPIESHPLSEALDAPAAMPMPPEAGDFQIPDDFLSRRPDVLVAEARLRAAIGEASLAERASWPSLRLLGSIASIALPGQFGDTATRSLAVGPVIEWNWLSFGRNQLREAAAAAGAQAAAADFEGAVLSAVAEADAAIRTWQAARQAWVEAVDAAKASERNYRRATTRAEVGLEPRVAAVSAELEFRELERRVFEAQAGALAAYAALHLALGANVQDEDAGGR